MTHRLSALALALAAAVAACYPLRDRTDEHDKTPLMIAAEAGDIAAVRHELADGARVNQRVRGYSVIRELLAFVAWMQQLPERDAGYGALHYAARAGGYERVRSVARGEGTAAFDRYREVARLLLDAEADPSVAALDGDTPLSLAALSGDTALVRLLIDRGAPVRRPAEIDSTAPWRSPLVAAALGRSVPVARVLLDAGADPNPREPGPASVRSSNPPIALAAVQGDTALVRLLLARGAEPDPVGQEGMTPLMTAAGGGHLTIVGALLAAGADPARRDQRAGWTAAQWAASSGHDSAAALLARADPASSGEKESQLVRAVQTRDVGRVRALLADGAMPNTRASSGSALVTQAVYLGDVEIARALLEAGARIDRLTSGEIPLVQRAAQTGSLELVRLLLDHGGSARQPGTATYAASSGRVDVLELVERAGANVREGADQPLRTAAIAGSVDAVRWLVARGAVADAPDRDGRTALAQAVAFQQHEVVRALLAAGADARQSAPESAFTPLMGAAMQGDSTMIGILLGAGADPAARDQQGKSAADYARGAGKPQVVPLLERGAGSR